MGAIAKQAKCIKTKLQEGADSPQQERCLKTTLTKLEQLTEKIAEDNQRFYAATAEQKRVMIAEDVLAQLDIRLTAKQGCYLAFENLAGAKWQKLYEENESLQELLLTNEQLRCKACGIGSLVLSCTLLTGLGTTQDLGQGRLAHGPVMPYSNRLEKYFSEDQLYAIEDAFELRAWHDRRAAYFGAKYEHAEARLRAIMKNIIQNNGTFKP